ncbi:MAG: hypothetical protein PHP00_01370 [Thiotrichaceae bacterium]|nr:hypothetical protein [Thiotrichaceae bacterium]
MAGLRSVVSVHRRGNRGKKQVGSESYYISSEEVSAYRFGKWIQGA